MAQIQFKQTNKYGSFTLHSMDYSYSKLFVKYTHTHTGVKKQPIKSGDIDICSELNNCSRKLSLKRDSIYEGKILEYVNVYFNKYCLSSPLLITFPFKEVPPNKRKFYKLLDFDSQIGDKNISSLHEYKGENTILETLINENNRLTELLTYDIERIQGHPIVSNGHYNGGKIKVEKDSSIEPKLSSDGFSRYKHTPESGNDGKKACVIYSTSILVESSGKPLTELQNIKYGYVNVYWSDKVDVPLLIELNVDPKKEENNLFYSHNLSNRLFWEKINYKNFDKYTDHKISVGDNIYQQLKGENYNKFIKLLKKLESNLLKILVLLVNRQNGSYRSYDINKIFENNPRLFFNKNVINIINNTNGKCSNWNNFRVYEHNFEDAVQTFPSGQDLKLKFISSNIESFSSNYLTIDLDISYSTRILYKSHDIQVSNGYNNSYKYSWYRHSLHGQQITERTFYLKFKKEYLKIKLDITDDDISDKIVIVYFKTDETDKFIIVAFPSTDQNKIKYLTFPEFKKSSSNKAEIKLSTLSSAIASVKSQPDDSGNGQTIDEDLLQLLNDEYEKNYSLRIQIDKGSDQNYKYGSLEITVSEQKNRPVEGFNKVQHSFPVQKNLYHIVFYHNFETKTLDIIGQFEDGIGSVSLYFHKTNPTIPLILCITTDRLINRFLKYSDFIYTFTDKLNLADLPIIQETDLENELKKQYQNITNDITLNIFTTKNYPGFNVSTNIKYGNYKYYSHTPIIYFRNIKLEEISLYKFTNFIFSSYTYDTLIHINVYYHEFDKENKWPLIIDFYTKSMTRQNKLTYNSSYYYLSDIEKTYIKIFKKDESKNKPFLNLLNETYEKYKNTIDKDLKIRSSNYMDHLLYIRRNTKLYVYFYGDDPRPLLLCYGNKAYKRYLLGERDSKWIEVPSVTSCLCNQNQGNTQIISVLNELAESLCLIEPNHFENKEEKSIEIDTSKTNATYNDPNNIIVSELEEYPNCNLFKYCTHSLTTRSTFRISTIKISKPSTRTIAIEEPISNVLSVKVYFSIHVPENPVLLEIVLDHGKKKYLKGLDTKKTISSNSDLIDIKDEPKLVEDLIQESDRINNRITYQIDKISEYNGIKVTRDSRSTYGFTMYLNSTANGLNKLSSVLYGKNLLVGRNNGKIGPVEQIENKQFKDITVYSLDLNKFPLLAQFKQSRSTNTYSLKKDQNGYYWMTDQFTFQNSEKTKRKLNEIYYPLKKSIIVKIGKKYELNNSNNYEIKLIDNNTGKDGLNPIKTNYFSAIKTSLLKTIKISDVSNTIRSLDGTSFKCYEHKLPDLKGSLEAEDISGLRLYMPTSSSNENDLIEIQLYSSTRFNNRIFLYFIPDLTMNGDKNKIFVYFHSDDHRALLIYYSGQAFKRSDNDKSKWISVDSIKKGYNDPVIKKTLEDIYSKITKKMMFVKNVENSESIDKRTDNVFVRFSKDSYFVKSQARQLESNYKISRNKLSSEIKDYSILDVLFKNLYGTLFDSINVYRLNSGFLLKDFLLLEFLNDSQKTYFQRIDTQAKYWVKESFSDNSSGGLQNKLQNIQNDISLSLIYEIDKIQRDNNSDITVSLETDSSITGFTKFKHTPNKNTHKKSLFLCCKKKLMKKVGHEFKQITELEGNIYLTVLVYFGTRAKKDTGAGKPDQAEGLSDTLPLMIELTKKDQVNGPEYYIHKRNPDGLREYYWEKLGGTNLRDLLTDIGFGLKKGKPGFEKLKIILTSINVIKSNDEIDDLSSMLTGIAPSNLKKLFVKEIDNNGFNKKLLELILKRIECDLVDSVTILLEEKDSPSNQYCESDINNSITNLHPKREVNRVRMSNGKIISVKDVTEKKGKCIQPYGYKIICHDIKDVIEYFGVGRESSVGIRFVMPTINNKYILITLYSNDKTEPQYVEYIYYSMGQDQVYVYFYGDDPRPLLLCYGNKAYKPQKPRDPIKERQVMIDYTTWVRVSTINSCVCSGDGTDSFDDKLLNALTEVNGYLNPVQLNPKQIPNIASTVITGIGTRAEYTLQRHISTTIIKIEILREDIKCYKKFSYNPYGTGNNNNLNFRLGNVIHHETRTDKPKGTLNYTNHTQHNYHALKRVEVYYYNNDYHFINPLLVELHFDKYKKVYYKLELANPSYSWTSLSSNQVDKEYKLLNELFNLNETFNSGNDKKPDKKECMPSDDTTTVASSTVTTVAVASGVGGGVLYYKYPGLVLSLISKIIPK